MRINEVSHYERETERNNALPLSVPHFATPRKRDKYKEAMEEEIFLPETLRNSRIWTFEYTQGSYRGRIEFTFLKHRVSETL